MQMKSLVSSVVAALALGMVSVSASAAGNLLTNGDFENNGVTVADQGYATVNAGQSAVTGWTVGGNSVDLVKGSYGFIDNISVDLAGTPGHGTLSQGFMAQVGYTYLLSFDHFVNHSGTDLTVTFGDLPAQIFAPPAAIQRATLLSWTPTLAWVNANGGNAKVTFASAVNGGDSGPTIDNVSVTMTAAVPEPQTMFMLLAGLGALGFLSRRRKA